MSEYLSIEALTAPDADGLGEDVTLPSGGTVRVRGLSRQEWFLVGKVGDGDGNASEAFMLHKALVVPALTLKQVEAWRAKPSASQDVAAASAKVRELTGVAEGAAKSNVAEVRD